MAADLINNLLIDQETQERFCPHCRVWKSFDQFSQSHYNKVSGQQTWCQTCSPPQSKPLDAASTKPCAHCKINQPYDEFYRDKGQKDGRDTRCRTCRQTTRYIKTHGGALPPNKEQSNSLKGKSIKTCAGCKISKPYEDFYRDKGQKDGRDSRCKTCRQTAYFLNAKGLAPPPIRSKERINWETGEKFCNGCKTWKPLETDFQRSKASASGRDSQCKDCTNAKARAARDRWPGGRHHQRLTFLRREELSEIRRVHGPNCDICNQPPKVNLIAVGSADEGLRGFMCEKCYKRYMNIYGPKPHHKGLVASDIAPFMHFKLRTDPKKEP